MYKCCKISMCEMGWLSMMETIEKIYEMMDWWSDEAVQEEGRMLAGEWTDLSLLILPAGKKSVWENCAMVF